MRIGITQTDETHTPALLESLYDQVEFYKNYAGAYAVSLPYKLWLMGLRLENDGRGDLSLLAERITAAEEQLLCHESKWFEAYMRSSGWTDMPRDKVKDGVYQNKLKRQNARLNAENTAALSALLGQDLASRDRKRLARIPDILRLANALSREKMSVVRLPQM